MYPPHTVQAGIKEVILACGVAPMVVLIVITEAAGVMYSVLLRGFMAKVGIGLKTVKN